MRRFIDTVSLENGRDVGRGPPSSNPEEQKIVRTEPAATRTDGMTGNLRRDGRVNNATGCVDAYPGRLPAGLSRRTGVPFGTGQRPDQRLRCATQKRKRKDETNISTERTEARLVAKGNPVCSSWTRPTAAPIDGYVVNIWRDLVVIPFSNTIHATTPNLPSSNTKEKVEKECVARRGKTNVWVACGKKI